MPNVNSLNPARPAISHLVMDEGKKIQEKEKIVSNGIMRFIYSCLAFFGNEHARTTIALQDGDNSAIAKRLEHSTVTARNTDCGKPVVMDGRVLSVSVNVDDYFFPLDLILNNDRITIKEAGAVIPDNEAMRCDIPWPAGLGKDNPADIVEWLQGFIRSANNLTNNLPPHVHASDLPDGYSAEKQGRFTHVPVEHGKEMEVFDWNCQYSASCSLSESGGMGSGEGAEISYRCDRVMDDNIKPMLLSWELGGVGGGSVQENIKMLLREFHAVEDNSEFVINGGDKITYGGISSLSRSMAGELFDEVNQIIKDNPGSSEQELCAIVSDELKPFMRMALKGIDSSKLFMPFIYDGETSKDFSARFSVASQLIGRAVIKESRCLPTTSAEKIGLVFLQAFRMQNSTPITEGVLSNMNRLDSEFKPAGVTKMRQYEGKNGATVYHINDEDRPVSQPRIIDGDALYDKRCSWGALSIDQQGVTIEMHTQFTHLNNDPQNSPQYVWEGKQGAYCASDFTRSAGISYQWAGEEASKLSYNSPEIPVIVVDKEWMDVHVLLGKEIKIRNE